MIVYLDSSIVLRRLFRQKPAFSHWGQWDIAVSSELLLVEAMRSIDRLRLDGRLVDEDVAACVQTLHEILSLTETIAISQTVLYRASMAYPTMIGTLDAIHLSSALLYKESTGKELVFLTHDRQLGNAALSVGLAVDGL